MDYVIITLIKGLTRFNTYKYLNLKFVSKIDCYFKLNQDRIKFSDFFLTKYPKYD